MSTGNDDATGRDRPRDRRTPNARPGVRPEWRRACALMVVWVALVIVPMAVGFAVAWLLVR